MNIGLTTDLDTSRFVSMLGDLQTIAPDKSFDRILRSTVAQVMSFCISRTPAPSRDKILISISKRHSARFTFPGGEVISESKRHAGHISFLDVSTARPGTPIKTIVGGKTWHDMTNFHWSDERWAKFQAFLAQANARKKGRKAGSGEDEKAALASRGLAKHSWYQIAEAVDVAELTKAPQWVRDAKPQNGKEYHNGRATIAINGTASMFITVFNDHPAVIRMGGQQLLNAGLAARVSAFERDVENGVFRDIEARAKRYPGIFLN
jgi:hypothetical protein